VLKKRWLGDNGLSHSNPPIKSRSFWKGTNSSLLQPWGSIQELEWLPWRRPPSLAASKITWWKQKWVMDGEMRLFGSGMHVWGEGVEWWMETRWCIFPSLSGSVLLSWHLLQHASTNLCYSPGSSFGCKVSPAQTFFFTRLKYLLHQKYPNMPVSWIINQQLLILGKQSLPKPEFILLVYWMFQKVTRETSVWLFPVACEHWVSSFI